MKSLPLLFALCSLLFATTAQAQWLAADKTQYNLAAGWNAIYLHGDAAPLSSVDPANPTMEELFTSYPDVTQVWRWNPNPTPVMFTDAPQITTPGKPEWNVWVRGGVSNTLTRMEGQRAYLVYCDNALENVNILQKAVMPSATWVRHGANLYGFPSSLTASNYPTFSDYFATFPAAIAANTKIYEYVGGPLGANNPMQIFSPSSARVDRNKAYWFSAEAVDNFYGPLEITAASAEGLAFGTSGSVSTLHIRNRASAAATANFFLHWNEVNRPNNSSYPRPVPLTRRVFNPTTLVWEDASATFNLQIPANSTVQVDFGIDRMQMLANSQAIGDHFGSLLYVNATVPVNGVPKPLMEVVVPVTAVRGSLAGLWIGEAQVKAVESKPQASAVKPTARAYPLRYIMHVADDGTARILSQVFMGKLASFGNPLGLCTKEAGLLQTEKAAATRFVSVHLPLDRVIGGAEDLNNMNTFNYDLNSYNSRMQRTISLPFDDPTNPFVHKFHPDHDNKAPNGDPLVAGQESYTVTRQVTFQFTSTAEQVGSTSSLGWGSSVIGGFYEEVISGLHKDSVGVGYGNGLKLEGTFELRRVSDIGSLSITP